MFTCPFTGAKNGLVPSHRRLKNGKRTIIWVHKDYVNARTFEEQ